MVPPARNGDPPGPRFELGDEEPRPRDPPRPGPADFAPAPALPEVDERTVAERLGTAPPRIAGRGPPPAGWPGEAFQFPLRAGGPPGLLLVALALTLLDLIAGWRFLQFPVWIAKLALAPALLAWQVRVAGASAAGRDLPVPWRDALARGLEGYGTFLRWAAALLLPGALLLLFRGRFGLPDSPVLGLALGLLGGGWLALVALSVALGDPSLRRPWRAVRWIVRRPLALLAGSGAWWALVAIEAGVLHLADAPVALRAALFFLLRLTGAYALLVSARALGVLGRAWTPYEPGP